MIFASLYIPVHAIDLKSGQLELEIQSLRNSGYNKMLAAGDEGEFDEEDLDIGFEGEETIYDYDYKSPKRAFVYSLLIPGWGQKYTESSTLKTIIFLGVEAGMWMGYFKNRNEGNKKTDEYEAFATEHWLEGDQTIVQSYRGWLAAFEQSEDTLTHQLPSDLSQQYYEMIGKYDQFRGGWDDYWEPVTIIENGDTTVYENGDYYEIKNEDTNVPLYISPNRALYNTMRGDANDFLDRANRYVLIAVVNHLLSAFDAALAARRYNQQQAAEMWLTFNTEMKKYSATEEIPIVKATLNF
jgi:hypothetical protein